MDLSKRENNISLAYLRKHKANMIKLKDYTLKTLIDDQDCAVEAVKLEWLLKNDLNERKKQRQVDIILYLLLIMCMSLTYLYF